MQTAVQTAKEVATLPPESFQKLEDDAASREKYGWLPCRLSLEIPIAKFTVKDLLHLQKGAILRTDCHHTGDIPARANGVLIFWTEFEVIATRLAVRVTELA